MHEELVERARAQEATHGAALENDVSITISTSSAAEGLAAGKFSAGINIAPNTTEDEGESELGAGAGFKPFLSMVDEKFIAIKYRARIVKMQEEFSKYAKLADVSSKIIDEVWVRVMLRLNKEKPLDTSDVDLADKKAQRPDLHGDAWLMVRNKFLWPVLEGEAPAIEGVEDPIKKRKGDLEALKASLEGGSASDAGWIAKAVEAGQQYDALFVDPKIVTNIRVKIRIGPGPEIAAALKTLEADGWDDVASASAVAAKTAEWKGLMPKWRELETACANVSEGSKHKARFDRFEEAIEAGVAAGDLARGEPLDRSFFATKFQYITEKFGAMGDALSKDLKKAFTPIYRDAFERAAAAMLGSPDFLKIMKAEPENTDNLWTDEDIAKRLREESNAWRTLAGTVEPRSVKSDAPKLWDLHLARLDQADAVIPLNAETQTLISDQPSKVKQFRKNLRDGIQKEIETLSQEKIAAFKAEMEAMEQQLEGKEFDEESLTAVILNHVQTVFAALSIATPPGIVSFLTKGIIEKSEATHDEGRGQGGAMGQFHVTTGSIIRALGMGSMSLPVVGPVVAGVGRFWVSWGEKNNALVAAKESLAEAIVLGAVQSFVLGMGLALSAPITWSLLGLGLVGVFGRATKNAEMTDTTLAREKFKDLDERVHDEEFETPIDIAVFLLYYDMQDIA
jgi:uncharacterized spore protein YtfJ